MKSVKTSNWDAGCKQESKPEITCIQSLISKLLPFFIHVCEATENYHVKKMVEGANMGVCS